MTIDRQPPTLARARRALPRRPDDRPRHDHRERRAAVDPRGPRLLRELARVGRERVPADLRRVPAARRTARRPLRAPAAVPRRSRRSSRAPRSPAASRARRPSSSRARAVQGVGGAIVAAVALSLIMTLFTEPAERAKAMGVFGFVAAGGGSVGVLLGGVLTDAISWHWIFLVNVPIGIAVFALSLVAASGRARRGARGTAGRRRRDHRDGLADARGLRDRERERGGLDVGADDLGCSPQPLRCWSSSWRSSRAFARRSSRSASSAFATSRPRTSSASSGRPRCSRGSSSRRSTCSSCSATARSRSGSPSCRRTLIMAALSLGLSAKLVHALRDQAAARDGHVLRRGRARCSSRGRRSTGASSPTCSRAW